MEHYFGFYRIEAAICKTDRIAYDPIVQTEKVWAREVERYGRWDECVYPPGLKGGLFPGVYYGHMPILTPSDMVFK